MYCYKVSWLTVEEPWALFDGAGYIFVHCYKHEKQWFTKLCDNKNVIATQTFRSDFVKQVKTASTLLFLMTLVTLLSHVLVDLSSNRSQQSWEPQYLCTRSRDCPRYIPCYFFITSFLLWQLKRIIMQSYSGHLCVGVGVGINSLYWIW